MSASYVSSVYLDIAPMQFKLNKDELWLLQNPEYHAIAQQYSKELKNESNSKIRRHTINIRSEPSSTPKIISVERKKCSETCEKTCIRRSITDSVTFPEPMQIEHKSEEKMGESPETSVKSKIHFFNKIASESSHFPKAVPRRRLSIRNDMNMTYSPTVTSTPKPVCENHVFRRDVRVFKVSSEDLAAANNAILKKNRDFPKFGTVKQNKQKFDHCLGSSFSEEKKIKRLSNPIELPITAVPVRLRIAEIEKKRFN